MAGSYWVELHTKDGTYLGAGFYVTRRFLFTADHCLKPLAEDERDIVVVHEDGSTAPAEVCERKHEADLALIRRTDKARAGKPPPADRCKSGDQWRSPNRPSASEPHLHGTVDEACARFECFGGSMLEALQLCEKNNLGTYSQYSGGAVERVGDEPALAGVLQEQVFDRRGEERATNVLWAATMREAFEQFDGYFDGVAPAPAPSAPADVTKALDKATAVLERAHDWQARGLMSPIRVEIVELNIASSIVDSTIGQVAQ